MLKNEGKMDNMEFDKFSRLGFFTVRRNNKFRSGTWTDMCIEQNLMKHIKTSGGLIHGRGLESSVIAKFISSCIVLVEVTDAMESFTNVSYVSSEQHVDASATRVTRDLSDLSKLMLFFEKHNPFPVTSNILSISTGLVGNEKINCYKAKEIGNLAMKKILKETFGGVKIPRSNKVTSLKSASSSVKVDDETIAIDPTLIFQRASLSIQTKGDMKKYLEYELSTYPLTLFNASGMRKTEKSKLYINFDVVTDITPKKDDYFIIDGGMLLLKLDWPSEATVEGIVQSYITYLFKSYSKNCCIVFDGYPENSGKYYTKTAERNRRNLKNLGHEVEIDERSTIYESPDKFFSVTKNKVRLIRILSAKLIEKGFTTKIAEEDADVLIVESAIDHVNENHNTWIVGQDIDLLVILVARAKNLHNIYFLKQTKDGSANVYSNQSFKFPEIECILLFLHAFSGCDTTSAFFNQGKLKLIKLLKKNKHLILEAEKFYDVKADMASIGFAGINIIRELYGAKKKEETTLNELRYNLFAKLCKKGSVKLESLPPTEGSTVQHAYRTYFQVQLWLGNKKSAIDWGWKMKNGHLEPLYTAEPLYPESLLKQISCSCKKGCKVKSCTCKKYGLFCSDLCLSCTDETCSNIFEPQLEISEDGLLDVEESQNFIEDLLEVNFQELTQDDADDIDKTSENEDQDEPERMNDDMISSEPLMKKVKYN
ncbi:hypothetical protein TKK_0019393 [Trichogramma kaykai]